jgi:hypothetical protein
LGDTTAERRRAWAARLALHWVFALGRLPPMKWVPGHWPSRRTMKDCFRGALGTLALKRLRLVCLNGARREPKAGRVRGLSAQDVAVRWASGSQGSLRWTPGSRLGS